MRINEHYEDFLDFLKREGRSHKSIWSYRHNLEGVVDESIGAMDVASFKITDVARVKEAGRLHGKYGSQRAVLTVRQYLKFLKESGHYVPLDWRDVKLPHVPISDPDALTTCELDIVLDEIPIDTIVGLRTRTILEVIYSTGMRISEALALQKHDVPWRSRSLKILNGKGGGERQVTAEESIYFTDRALTWIKKYLNERTDGHPALFVTEYADNTLTATAAQFAIRKYLRPAQEKIKKHIYHHLFRKTFVTHLLEGGADIKAVQYLARHKSERTTLRHYAAVNKDRARSFHDSILNRA